MAAMCGLSNRWRAGLLASILLASFAACAEPDAPAEEAQLKPRPAAATPADPATTGPRTLPVATARSTAVKPRDGTDGNSRSDQNAIVALDSALIRSKTDTATQNALFSAIDRYVEAFPGENGADDLYRLGDQVGAWSYTFIGWLGLVFDRYEPDDVVLRLPFRDDLTNDGVVEVVIRFTEILGVLAIVRLHPEGTGSAIEMWASPNVLVDAGDLTKHFIAGC